MMRILALSLVTLMSFGTYAVDLMPAPGPGHGPGHGPGGGGHPPGPGPGHGPGGGHPPGPGPGGPPPPPGHGPGPGAGPGGGGPFMNPCDMTYDGGYGNGTRATFSFRNGRVSVFSNGRVWTVRVNCDRNGFEFNAAGYYHRGQFVYRAPFFVDGLQGTEYYGNRPYQNFSARARR